MSSTRVFLKPFTLLISRYFCLNSPALIFPCHPLHSSATSPSSVPAALLLMVLFPFLCPSLVYRKVPFWVHYHLYFSPAALSFSPSPGSLACFMSMIFNSLGDHTLSHQHFIQDIGVTFDDKLRFGRYCISGMSAQMSIK